MSCGNEEFAAGYSRGYQDGFKTGLELSTEYDKGWNDAKAESTAISQEWYEKTKALGKELATLEESLQQALKANAILEEESKSLRAALGVFESA